MTGAYGDISNDNINVVSTSFVHNFALGNGGAGYFERSHSYLFMQSSESLAKSGVLETEHPYLSQPPQEYNIPTVLDSLYLCGLHAVNVTLCDSHSDGDVI